MATALERIDKSWSGMDTALVRAVVHRICSVAYRDSGGGCRCAKAPADKPRHCDAFDGHARGIIDLVQRSHEG